MKVSKLFDLSGKVALITGGSRGLGLQMAEGARDTSAARPFSGSGAKGFGTRTFVIPTMMRSGT